MGSNSIFNTHIEQVDAPSAVAWTVFLDRARWMASFGSRKLVHGIDDMPGAIAEVTTAVAGSPMRREEILFCEGARRLVVRITADDTDMAAHADFQFQPSDVGCRIQVSIHSWMPGSSPEDRERMQALTQEKIVADFAQLGRVIGRA